ATTARPRRSGQPSAGVAGSAAESARRCDQRVLPGSVADLVNPQVTRHATGFEAVQALLRTSRRSLQMVLRLLAHNAEHWLSRHLNAYLCDDDEYRAITRETIIRGLAGRHHLHPGRDHRPARGTRRPPRRPGPAPAPRRDLNQAPPSLPGDPQPITYQLAARTSAFNS